ncbi:hypothetical protein [Quadrisphaera sp. KR29]|uniref:hypothetical protein n=1 Tax=Quadrisphaera sp. KR29 TaxID=3461391 RepID=UPI004044D671
MSAWGVALRRLRTAPSPRAATALDQAISSVSNFALQLFVARTGDLALVGVFAVGFGAYVLLTSSLRALLFEPALVVCSREPARRLQVQRSAVTTALAASVALGVVMALTALLLPAEYRLTLLTYAAGMPVLVLADGLRYARFADGRPQGALAVDAVWTGSQAVLFAALVVTSGDAEGYLLAWIAGAAVAVLTGARALRGLLVRPRAVAPGWRSLKGLGLPGLADSLLGSGVQQLLPLGVTLLAGTTAAGVVRTAQTMLSPVNTVIAASTLLALPAAAAAAGAGDRRRYWRAGRRQALVLVGLGVVVGLAYALAPSALLQWAFGEAAEEARPVTVVLSAQVALIGWGIAVVTLLRAALAARTVLLASAVTAPFTLGAPLVGAVVAGPLGVGVGMLVAALLWALWLSAAVARRHRAGVALGSAQTPGGELVDDADDDGLGDRLAEGPPREEAR